MSESQSNGTKGCNSRAHNPSKPCQSTLFPIDQLQHPCHLQPICWCPFILAVLDHLEQERFWEAAAFFPATTKIIKCCFRQKPKEGAPGRHRYIYIYISLSLSLSLFPLHAEGGYNSLLVTTINIYLHIYIPFAKAPC